MRRSIVTLLALVALAAAGCTPAPDEGDGARPRFLSIGTAPQGGTFYVIGSALAEVLTTDEAGWQVTAEATKGSQENIRRLEKGEIDLALANSAITYFASRGELGWSHPYPVRTVMTLAPNVGLFIAPEGGGVESILDLEGKRVVMGPAGAGFDFFLRPIIEAHGLTYQDFSPLHASQFDAVSLLADGSASAAFLGGGVPTPRSRRQQARRKSVSCRTTPPRSMRSSRSTCSSTRRRSRPGPTPARTPNTAGWTSARCT
jgi:TRAP transporter TAXI family solute receptor